MQMQPSFRAVLITGSSRGIGEATAKHLAGLGYRVFAGVRDVRDAERLRSQASDRMTPMILDVTNQEQIRQVVHEIEQRVGDRGLWGLINNAGNAVGGPLEFISEQELRRLFEVHVFGTLALTRAALPLVRRSRGRIVNVSSTASLMVAPFHGPYSAAKLALNGLSDALRLELRPHGTHVSTIICGSVRTEIWEKGIGLSRALGAQYPPHALELYGDAWQRLMDYFLEIGRSGETPENAARIIGRAITDKRPHNVYYVGRDARTHKALTRLLSSKLKDKVILRRIGLPRD